MQDNQEEFEIDLNDDEPEFLKGHSSRSGIEMSPVKIVKNPEGSLQRAAMTQVRAAGAGLPAVALPVQPSLQQLHQGAIHPSIQLCRKHCLMLRSY